MKKMIVPIVFVVLGGLFVFFLFQGIFTLLNYDFKGKGLDAKTVYTLFKIPIISFVLLILFVVFVIPFLQENGMG